MGELWGNCAPAENGTHSLTHRRKLSGLHSLVAFVPGCRLLRERTPTPLWAGFFYGLSRSPPEAEHILSHSPAQVVWPRPRAGSRSPSTSGSTTWPVWPRPPALCLPEYRTLRHFQAKTVCLSVPPTTQSSDAMALIAFRRRSALSAQ